MKPLYTQLEFELTKSHEKLPCECYECNKIFYTRKADITRAIKNNFQSGAHQSQIKFCSNSCQSKTTNKSQIVSCLQCKKEFLKKAGQIKKSLNHFCSHSCSATYSNTHKITGNRRSKLEIWLEKELTNLYPQLVILYCEKETINSELDIYIPSLHLAFELNGIFHYEPIYGQEKLQQIQNNDDRKFAACLEKQISLCIIDSSSQKRFTEQSSQKFLEIIKTIIEQNIGRCGGDQTLDH